MYCEIKKGKVLILNLLVFHEFFFYRTETVWNSLVVQWLGLGSFTAMAPGSILGQGTKIPQAAWCCQKKKKRTETVSEPEAVL